MQILGFSKLSLAIIFDMMFEFNKKERLNVFMNRDFGIDPYFPLKMANYKLNPYGVLPDNKKSVIFGVTGPRAKSIIFADFLEFANILKTNYKCLIHKSSYVASSSKISNGVFIEPHVVISSQSEIKFGVFIKRGSLVGHHNKIGEFSDIHPGVILSGNVTIGRGCVVGSGAIVRNNVTIGDNTYVGMGSVVTKNLPSGVIAYGNPCKVKRSNNIWNI